MKISIRNLSFVAASFLAWQFLVASALAQGNAFTYQGRLSATNGAPADGSYDIAFTLFATNVTGTPIAGPVTNTGVGVSNGLFTTMVNFNAAFTGESNWLEIAVSTNAANAFSTLAPRQQLTPVPYALVAANVSGPVALSQLPSSLVTNGASGVTISGTFSGNGAGVTNVPGVIPTQGVSGTSVTAASNHAYLLTNNAFTTVTLPSMANPGDVVTITGLGTNGWQVGGPGQPLQNYPGTYWSANNNSQPLSWASVASSADGTHLVAGVNQGNIWTSTNSGLTWTNNNNAPSTAFWGGVASSSNGTALVAVDNENSSGGKIWTSANSGITWSSANNSLITNWVSVASSADGTHLIAADYGNFTSAGGGQLWLSVNSGSTWTLASGAPISTNWNCVASSADGTHLVAATPSSSIYTSANSGSTWSDANGSPTSFWAALASSANGANLVAVGSGGVIENSTNAGVTWTNYAGLTFEIQHINWSSVASSADGTRLAAVPFNNGPVYMSANSGVIWTNLNNNSPFTQWAAVASSADGTHLVAAVSGGQIWTGVSPLYVGGAGTTIQFHYTGNGWAPGAASFSGPPTVTNFPDVSGPLPASYTFTSHGGRLLISAIGSGTPITAGSLIGMVVQLDGVPIGTNQIYANNAIHMPFEAKTAAPNSVAPGSHTITLTALPSTTTSSLDLYSATVQELPY